MFFAHKKGKSKADTKNAIKMRTKDAEKYSVVSVGSRDVERVKSLRCFPVAIFQCVGQRTNWLFLAVRLLQKLRLFCTWFLNYLVVLCEKRERKKLEDVHVLRIIHKCSTWGFNLRGWYLPREVMKVSISVNPSLSWVWFTRRGLSERLGNKPHTNYVVSSSCALLLTSGSPL